MKYYLAIDIGASSGRHILGWLENGKMAYEELHRFPNTLVKKDGKLCWDLDALFDEILTGLKKCAAENKIPESVGIDTWGVDFVLLDENDSILGNTVAYRDSRTEGMDEEVFKLIPEKELYRRTGIQKMVFNTVFQLMAVKKEGRYLQSAKKLLMLPDYLHYRLCGEQKTEYTAASTSGLVNAAAKTWDLEILRACGYPEGIFLEIVPPGTVLGKLTPEIQRELGFCCKVICPAAHDTGSAVMAVPSQKENTLYISSGTWSLMGVERQNPDCSDLSRESSFTNEGGYNYRYRYLRNIMGLWMIQSVKRELQNKYSFDELCAMAKESGIASLIDCNDNAFLAPPSMIEAIRQFCAGSSQQIPQTPGELAAVIYNSLAACYRDTVAELEQITGQTYGEIHIVGGGSKAAYLNELTAKYTGKKVLTGPTEATAIGNLLAQMIASGELRDLAAGRECVAESFLYARR